MKESTLSKETHFEQALANKRRGTDQCLHCLMPRTFQQTILSNTTNFLKTLFSVDFTVQELQNYRNLELHLHHTYILYIREPDYKTKNHANLKLLSHPNVLNKWTIYWICYLLLTPSICLYIYYSHGQFVQYISLSMEVYFTNNWPRGVILLVGQTRQILFMLLKEMIMLGRPNF